MILLVSLAEGARFETPTAAETIDIDLLLSFRPQSLTDESETEEKSIETIGHDSSATV